MFPGLWELVLLYSSHVCPSDTFFFFPVEMFINLITVPGAGIDLEQRLSPPSLPLLSQGGGALSKSYFP